VPLLRVLVPFCAGILLAEQLSLAPGLFALVAAAGLALCGPRPARRYPGLGEALLGVGLGALALAARLHAPVPEIEDGPVLLSVLRPPVAKGFGCQIEVHLHGKQSGAALLQAPERACDWLPGQEALGRIRLRRFRPATNPGQRSYSRRWARRGIHRSAVVREELLFPVGPEPRDVAARLERTRRALAGSVDPEDSERRSGALLRALVVGDRTRLSPELRDAFRHSGTAHLLAVSGLHVGWIFVMASSVVGFVLRRTPSLALVRRARPIAMVAGLLASCSYAALSGLGLPALRAAAMGLAGTLALLGGRPGAAWNALALAALVVLAWDPASMFEAPFALSFAAVAGILVWGVEEGRLAALLHATLGAGLATAPFIAAFDAPLPWLAPLANLLAVPLFGAVILPLGLMCAAVGALFSSTAAILGSLAGGAAEVGIRLVEGLASPSLLEGSAHPIRLALGLAASGFALRMLARGERRAALLLSAAAASLLVLALPQWDPRSEEGGSILFLDVGHGDAIFLRGERGTWLVDAGPRSRGFDAGRSIVRPALRAERIRRLDVLLLSHSDRDHIGGARAILEATPVGELWLTRSAWESAALETVQRIVGARGIPVRLAAAGDRASLPPFELSVLWPPAGFSSRSTNHASLVLRVEGPHGCALLPGDVPSAVERQLAPELEACELLKLAHHGSGSSTDAQWLRRLRPWVAIASAGRRSRAPLPHAAVRKRLREESVTLYETWRRGAVRVRFGPAGMVVEPFLRGAWSEARP